VEIRDLSDFSVFASKMIKLIEAQKKIVEHVSELCEESKRDFMKSRIERQIYEKIKEYHYMEYNKMVYREEQKISDELANINHGRLERNLANEQY
ncbi:MAG: flagellar FliJ family protein, partial [Tepidanaerobacteraceae bacterium]